MNPLFLTSASLLLCLSVSLLDFNPVFASEIEDQRIITTFAPKIDQIDRPSLIKLGQAYSRSKNHASAIKTFTAALAGNEKDVEVKTLIAQEQTFLKKDTEALQILKEVFETNPKYRPAYKLAIEIYKRKNNNKYELRILYQDMIEQFGSQSEYLSALCEISTLDALYDLSQKYCKDGISKNPADAKNYVFLGLSFKDMGETAKAERFLKKAADSFSKSEFAQISYAEYLDSKKNFINSISYYKRALAANPSSAKSNTGFGLAALEVEKYQEALDAFNKACKIDKTSVWALRKAANILRGAKKSDWLKKFDQAEEKCR